VTIAESIGLKREVIEPYLLSKEGETEIKTLVNKAYQEQITGVPHFLIEDQYEVSGGEKPETFLQIFKRLGVY